MSGSSHYRAATIGGNVHIGSSVRIVEDELIESCVTIDAGSIVTKNIPENASAAEYYAKVLNYRNPGRYIKNRWNVELAIPEPSFQSRLGSPIL